MNICPVCNDGITPEDRFQFKFAGLIFCTRTCAEIYCSNHIEHQCSFCSENLCNVDESDIVTSGNQIFCCKDHMMRFAKMSKDADMYDHVNDR